MRSLAVQWNVVFFGQHNLKGSLKYMGAFWLSVAGMHSLNVVCGHACMVAAMHMTSHLQLTIRVCRLQMQSQLLSRLVLPLISMGISQ